MYQAGLLKGNFAFSIQNRSLSTTASRYSRSKRSRGSKVLGSTAEI